MYIYIYMYVMYIYILYAFSLLIGPLQNEPPWCGNTRPRVSSGSWHSVARSKTFWPGAMRQISLKSRYAITSMLLLMIMFM